MSSLENPPQVNPESLSDEEKEVAARIKKSFESSESIVDFLKYKNLKEKAYFGRLNEEELDELLALDFEEELDANPPIRGVFSPENELNKIKRLHKSEKGFALYEFKEKLSKQREALASSRVFIERCIEFDNDVSREKLLGWLKKFSENYGFSGKQKKKAEKIIDGYYFYRQNALDLRAAHPDDLDLIHELSGIILPQDSDIKVEMGPISVDITASGIDAKRIDEGLEDVKIPLEYYGFAMESKHKKPVLYVVVNKDLPDAGTLIHEREHAKNVIFHAVLDKQIGEVVDKEFFKQYDSTQDAEIKRTILESYFYLKMEQGLDRAKDEVMAIKKEGQGDPDYQDLILSRDNESYDYLASTRDMEGRKDDPLWQKLAEKILVKEYGEVFNKGIAAFSELENGGYTRDGIIAMLMDKPMAAWPKTAKRLLEYQRNKLK